MYLQGYIDHVEKLNDRVEFEQIFETHQKV